MEHETVQIRVADPRDAPQLQRIYAHYVENTAISFEYEVPDAGEFRRRMVHILEGYPFLAVERAGEILGHANTKAFIPRAAYDWSAEVTIYLRQDCCHMGLGARLYRALEEISRAQHILNLNACIGWPREEDEYLTRNSAQFHAHMGYRLVGTFRGSGCKFGRWYDMVWMEKLLGEHTPDPPAVIPFPALPEETLARLGIRRK